MHTFFINTSQKELNEYEVLFDIHYENKSLVSMECLMSDWCDENKGYTACVRQMCNMIDGYVELDNSFNVVVYVDLPEISAYSSIYRDAFHDRERNECSRALHILFTHTINESIVQELIKTGRKPKNVLIMFGEERQFVDFSAAISEPGKAGTMTKLFALLGIPQVDTVAQLAKTVDASGENDKVSAFRNKIAQICGKELVPGIRDGYSNEFHLWCDEVMNEADTEKANVAFFERINDIYTVETNRLGIREVSCPYDSYACTTNKSALALSEMNIALYLLECVESNTLTSQDGEGKNRPIAFHAYTAQEIAPILEKKKALYTEKVAEIESMAKSYAELQLAPQLPAFDNAKFGLNIYGDKATDLVVNTVVPEEKEEKSKGNGNAEKEDSGTIEIKGNDKEVTVVYKQRGPLFSKAEYQAFDYNYDEGGNQMHKKNTRPEQYVEQAKKVRRHHLEYLKKLKMHVSGVLSNYAGKSKENKPALLHNGGYRYAAPGKEERVLESVESVSEKAYETIVNQYMEFCAGRTVAISDIEEQCNWFVSRVNQIKESLRKIKIVAIGLLIAIIILYIPYVVIQFEAIVENLLTLVTALCSIAIPILLLYSIFLILSLLQRRKYIKAWDEFKEKSDLALKENKIAVEKYDQLLSTAIPALRWVYEYKLDVDYCVECSRVADAKIGHHRAKLYERIAAIGNILSDLEISRKHDEDAKQERVKTLDEVDYNVPFCCGEKNSRFYAILDSKTLNEIKN